MEVPLLFAVLHKSVWAAGIIEGLVIHLSNKPNGFDNPGLFWDQLFCWNIDSGRAGKPVWNAQLEIRPFLLGFD